MAQTSYKHLDEKEQKDRRPDRKTLKRLYAYGTPYLPQFILIFLLIFIAIGMTLLQPRLIQLLIDNNIYILVDPGRRSLRQSGKACTIISSNCRCPSLTAIRRAA